MYLTHKRCLQGLCLLWARSWWASPLALDIPPACGTRDALFGVAGRARISPGQHTPLPNHTRFWTMVNTGQLDQWRKNLASWWLVFRIGSPMIIKYCYIVFHLYMVSTCTWVTNIRIHNLSSCLCMHKESSLMWPDPFQVQDVYSLQYKHLHQAISHIAIYVICWNV